MGRGDLGPGATRRGGRAQAWSVFAAVRAAGRTPRPRLADLLIAATAASIGLPLYTRNPADFAGLEAIVAVQAV